MRGKTRLATVVQGLAEQVTRHDERMDRATTIGITIIEWRCRLNDASWMMLLVR